MTLLAERPIQDQPRWSKAARPPMPPPAMAIEPLQPSRYPVTSAPGAVAALRATVPGGQATEAKRREPVELDPAPTADALTAVQVAAQAYEVLKKAGRELRFETSAEGILRIEVYDGTGRLVRSIPPNEALALASGEASWQA